jgi:hypothetical protein
LRAIQTTVVVNGFSLGDKHRLCTKFDGGKGPLKQQQEDILMLLFLPKQILS